MQTITNVLRINAAVSGASGALAAVAADPLADAMGIDATALRITGVALVVFALDVALASRARGERLRSLTRLIGIADAAWVVVTVALVGAGAFSTVGAVVTLAVAAVVATFAWFELRPAELAIA